MNGVQSSSMEVTVTATPIKIVRFNGWLWWRTVTVEWNGDERTLRPSDTYAISLRLSTDVK